MKQTSKRRRPARRASLVFAWGCIFAIVCGPAARAALNEDLQVLDHMVRELRYCDTALRFLAELKRENRGDSQTEAVLAFTEVDVLKACGQTDEALKLLAEVQKKYPNDPRASLGGLEALGTEMQKVTDLFDRAMLEPDKAKAQALRTEAAKLFDERVVKGIDGLIQDLEKRLAAARAAGQKDAGKDDKDAKGRRRPVAKARERTVEETNITRSLHYTELVRLQFYLACGRRLDAGAARTAILEKGAQLAEKYVTDRSDFPVMQFEGQLNLGQMSYELGRYETAQEQLSLIYDVEPGFEKPWPKEVADAFLRLRLQAVLFGARSMNAAHASPKAADIIRKHVYALKQDELGVGKAESSPDHRSFGILVRLEYGISLAGGGQVKEGLDMILKVIETPGMPDALKTDARKALGRLALLGGVQLRAKHYYEAALGLKAERRFDDALVMFQTALGALSPRQIEERKTLAPLCLSEIGDAHVLLGNTVEAALAYGELCRYFPTAQKGLLSTASKRFLNRTQAAIKSLGADGSSHAGLAALEKDAKDETEKFAGGFTVYEGIMGEAQRLEGEGKLAEAGKKFLEVPAETGDGERIPFYNLAQARGHRAVLGQWEQANAEQRKALEEQVTASLAALEKVHATAIRSGDKLGAAIASFARGQHFYNREQYAEAVTALTPFLAELLEVPEYRCFGLTYLILAEARSGRAADGAKHYQEVLEKLTDCKEAQGTAIAAQTLSDAFERDGNSREAGRFMGFYARHSTSREELAKPEVLAEVISRLLRGGFSKTAQRYIAILKEKGGAQDEHLKRQIKYFDALGARQEKQYDKAIAILTEYVETFQPQVEDKAEEDAHALHELGECYLLRQSKPSLDDLANAQKYTDTACKLMQVRAEREPKLEPVFWQWTYDYFQKILMRQGDMGLRNQYLRVVQFMDGQRKSDMAGMKDKFLALEKQAREKFDKAVKK